MGVWLRRARTRKGVAGSLPKQDTHDAFCSAAGSPSGGRPSSSGRPIGQPTLHPVNYTVGFRESSNLGSECTGSVNHFPISGRERESFARTRPVSCPFALDPEHPGSQTESPARVVAPRNFVPYFA
jgi:hypothetical protein